METQQEQSPSLEDCLKLLKGGRAEQRLTGLLLVTKFCKGDDLSSLRRVYDAIGPLFFDRLLRTGMGKGTITSGQENDRDAYLRLSVTVLAAFCRLPEVASLEDMVLKIPLILEVMSTENRVLRWNDHSGASDTRDDEAYTNSTSVPNEGQGYGLAPGNDDDHTTNV